MTNASKNMRHEKIEKKIGGNSEKARFFRLLERPNGSRALKLPKDIPWRKIKVSFFFVNLLHTNMRNAIKSFNFVIKLNLYKSRIFSKKNPVQYLQCELDSVLA